MKPFLNGLVAVVVAIYAIAAPAQEMTEEAPEQTTLLEYVTEACEADLEAYCDQVTPGNGRLMHCVAAHEDKISGQCGYALYEAAVLLQELTAAIAYLGESCGEELKSMCSDVEMGEGRVMACLEANRADLGETCASAISGS